MRFPDQDSAIAWANDKLAGLSPSVWRVVDKTNLHLAVHREREVILTAGLMAVTLPVHVRWVVQWIGGGTGYNTFDDFESACVAAILVDARDRTEGRQ